MSEIKLDKETVAHVFNNIKQAVDLFDGRDSYGPLAKRGHPLYSLCEFMSQSIYNYPSIDLAHGELFLSSIFDDLTDHGCHDVVLSLDRAVLNMLDTREDDEILLIAHKLKILSKRVKYHVTKAEKK